MDPQRKHAQGFPSYQALKRTSDKTGHSNGTLWYRVENIETKKEYNEFCVLCTHMIILTYNEDTNDKEQKQYLIVGGKIIPIKSYNIS